MQTTTHTRSERLEQRAQSLLEALPFSPRDVYRFLTLSIQKASTDNLGEKAAALAFVTIISLIPLLAAFSFHGTRWFSQQQAQAVDMLSRILPYSEETILTTLQQFLDQAGAIRGVGFLLFVLAALAVFSSIDKILNRIWNVPQRRPFRSRLLSFTLLLFWGPLVIGGTYVSLLALRRPFTGVPYSLPAGLVSFLMTLLGLSMLYWLVPYTSVRLRSALLGGVTATLLLLILRQSFTLYVELVPSISVIYGGFGFAFLFMISIQLSWWIVLLGCEVAYCAQNAEHMSRVRTRLDAAAGEGTWIALAALAVIARRFAEGEPITPHEALAERLQMETEQLHRALVPLVESGLLRETGGDDEGFLLGLDPRRLEVARVFELYDGLQRQLLAPLDNELGCGLEAMRQRLAGTCRHQVEGLTLAQLVDASAACEDAA